MSQDASYRDRHREPIPEVAPHIPGQKPRPFVLVEIVTWQDGRVSKFKHRYPTEKARAQARKRFERNRWVTTNTVSFEEYEENHK